MGHTGDERLLKRPIIGPFGADFVDGGVVYGRFPVGVCRHRQALPRHPRVEDPQDEMKDTMIAQFALRPPLRPREVREDTCGELRLGELNGNRRRCRLLCRCVHHAKASREDIGSQRENHIVLYITKA